MNFEIYKFLNLDYMEIHIIDLKTNTRIKINNGDQFKNINIGHRVFANYIDTSGINRCINGTICSVEHQIDKNDKTFDYTLIVKVY